MASLTTFPAPRPAPAMPGRDGTALDRWFDPLREHLASGPARRAALDILRRHGRSSLDLLKLWPDKTLQLLGDDTSLVAYRDVVGVRMALGDITGPAAHGRTATEEFVRRSIAAGRRPAIAAAEPSRLSRYGALGMGAVAIGAEALVDLRRFAADTASHYDLRRYVRPLDRAGWSFALRRPPHSAELVNQLAAVSTGWLTLRGRRERSFGLGSFSYAYAESAPVALIHDAGGEVGAFVTLLPGGRPGTLAVDLMRRRPDAPAGAMTHLLHRVMLAARAAGARSVSLGITPLAGPPARPPGTATERLLGIVYRRANWYFSFRGLRRFKAKFDPRWEPRYLVSQGGTGAEVRALAALTWAMHRAP